ncbi:MAG: hypothetical protein JW809_19945, partial [Pirellulales bacterium]|nr:hypothetical protein [Pirellulales bacterium]
GLTAGDTTTVYGQGGTDTAYLYDSAGNDTFTAEYNEVTMQYSDGPVVTAQAFDDIFADFGQGGYDYCDLLDSSGDDDLYVDYDTVLLDWMSAAISLAIDNLNNSDMVHAYNPNGGTDTKYVGDINFYFDDEWS